MTVPHFLQGAFRYVRLPAVSDVQDIITSVRDEVLVQLPVGSRWTDLGADVLRTPLDADGRFLTVELNKIALTNLELIITDDDGISFTRRMQLTTTPIGVNIFSGPQYLFIDSELAAPSNEGIWTALLDLFPLPQLSHHRYVVGQGSRNAADANDTNYFTSRLMERNVSDVYVTLLRGMVAMGGSFAASIFPMIQSISLATVGMPILVTNNTPAIPTVFRRLMGRLFQTIFVSSSFAQGTNLIFALDETTLGTFRVLAIPVETSLPVQLAVRIA